MRKLLFSTAAILLSVAAAKADTIYQLGVSNTSGVGTGPYATLDVALTSPTTATLTYSADSSFVFGEVGANVNAGMFTATPPTFTLAATSNQTPSYTDHVGGSLDGFGNFVIDDQPTPNGFSSAVVHLVVMLTDTGGTWSSSSNVLTPNGDGNSAAVHAFTSTGNSFFAANDAPIIPPVPEPSALLLMGSGLLGLGWVTRRRA